MLARIAATMMKARTICTGLLLMSAGCATAVISDIGDSALTVQQGTGVSMAEVTAEATRGCGLYGKAATGPISQRCADPYCFTKLQLFACTGPSTVRSAPAPVPPQSSAALPAPVTVPEASRPEMRAPPLPPASTLDVTTNAGTEACAPYAADPAMAMRCSWITGPQRARYVPPQGEGRPLADLMRCHSVRDDPAQYSACMQQGG